MADSEFDELKKRSLLRQRRKANLVEYETTIKKLMELDVSLPVILEWLILEKEIATTLPALRRFVIRSFSEEVYVDFTIRNGWQKNKAKQISHLSRTDESKKKSNSEKSISKGGVTQEELKESLRQKIDLNHLDEE